MVLFVGHCKLCRSVWLEINSKLVQKLVLHRQHVFVAKSNTCVCGACIHGPNSMFGVIALGLSFIINDLKRGVFDLWDNISMCWVTRTQVRRHYRVCSMSNATCFMRYVSRRVLVGKHVAWSIGACCVATEGSLRTMYLEMCDHKLVDSIIKFAFMGSTICMTDQTSYSGKDRLVALFASHICFCRFLVRRIRDGGWS